MKKILLLAFFAALLPVRAAEPGFKLEYHFDEPDFSIVDSGGGRHNGVFRPAASKDQDQNEVTDVRNYRKKGVSGNALFFKSEYGSYADVSKTPAPFLKPQSKLLIRLYVNIPNKSGFQYILGNKSDSAKGGFALLKAGHQWRFNYSDGKAHYRLEYPSHIPDGEWGLLEVLFDNGTVTIKENNRVMTSKKFHGKVIAPNGTKLHFGNYVTSNKKVYPCNGGIDELLISSDLGSSIAAQKVELKTINAICEPVDGAESFYGGVKTLHTFREFPVPVSFLLGYAGAKLPSLELVLPEGVAIRDSYNGNHNKPDQQYKFIRKGDLWQLAPGSLHPDWQGKFPEKVVVALTVPENFSSGTVKWQVKDGNKIQYADQFVLKVIPAIEPLPEGRFYAWCYMAQDIAFYDLKQVNALGELFRRSGIQGKGRYYKHLPRRVKIDELWQEKYQFKLYDISIWCGPVYSVDTYAGLAGQALDPRGGRHEAVCPYGLAREPAARAEYEKFLRNSLNVKNTKAVVLDFEPWGMTGKFCFCGRCIAEFRKFAGIPDDIRLDGRIILGKYSEKWKMHWLKMSSVYQQMLADTARKIIPGVEVWDYTYVFPYNDPQALSKRFWGIPKDPRLNEAALDGSLLSLYHINGRKVMEQIDLSRRHLKKNIAGIITISRANRNTGGYTPPEEALSPAKVTQKAVLLASLGHENMSIYPGHWLDGSMHTAMNKAIRIARENERFYLDGKRCDSAVRVTALAPAADWCYTAWKNGGEILVTIFNFSGKPMQTKVNGRKVHVETDGFALVKVPSR